MNAETQPLTGLPGGMIAAGEAIEQIVSRFDRRRLFDRENGDSTYWLPLFLDFLARIKISSKEMPEPAPMTPYGAQIQFLDEVCAGLDRGVHMFVTLKARQLGISTIMLALDIFWLWMFPGLQGALIADTAENKDQFKETITIMLEGLPEGFRPAVKRHNRNGLILKNGSRLMYMSAGRRKNSGLGKSRALNFAHCTECSEWADQEGLESLLATLAQQNPNRLYVFESTAQGYNLFHTMCDTAQKSPGSQHFIFIGWWAKEVYSKAADTPEYAEFWLSSPTMTPYEQRITTAVAERYGHAIKPEQWAWYRAESAAKATTKIKQNYPSLPEEAFQFTGNSFFESERISADERFIATNAIMPRTYSVQLGETFTAMRVADAAPGSEDADLLIWEPPNPRGRYVMGVDPATGEAEGSNPDRTAITIWRGYADKLVQVAEYATTNPTSQQCCWVMSYLAACYRDCMLNVEKNGPGLAVMNELKTLRMLIHQGEMGALTLSLGKSNALDGIRWFLYHRVDSMGGEYIYNFTSNPRSKSELLNSFRDGYNAERLVPRSLPLLGEMKTLRQSGAKIKGSGRNKDDRVFGAALAHRAWTEFLRPQMQAERRTFQSEMDAQKAIDSVRHGSEDGAPRPIVDHLIKGYFTQRSMQRSEAAKNRLLNLDY